MKKVFVILMLSMVFLNGLVLGEDKKESVRDLKIGEIGFLKLSHDAAKGSVTVELVQVDKKTALTIEGDLKLNAIAGGEKKEFVLKAKDGKYEVTDNSLKKEFVGKFVLKSGDKQYVVSLADHDDHHGHKH